MPDVKLKNYEGTPWPYQAVPKVWLESQESTEENRILVPFTYGEAVAKTVEPDFSGGDMPVPIPEGELVTQLTIAKPENLVPENIKAGETVAGVLGTHEGGGESGGLDPYLRYFDTNIDLSEGTITLIKIYYDRLYADNGSYDVTIPDTICGLQVVIAAS